MVILPNKLTAENGAKALLIGEYKIPFRAECCNCGGDGMDPYEPENECEDCRGSGSWTYNVDVPWTMIKDIYKKIVENFSQQAVSR